MTGDLLALLVADDLTGAADSAVAFARRGVLTRVVFDPPSATTGGQVVAVDTDTRRADEVTAARAVATAVTASPRARVVFKKIDSTLRGNVAAETEAMLRASGAALAVCAPAFPGTGRTTVEGVQHVSGEAIGDVAALFAGVPVDGVPLAAVREGSLADRLEDLLTRAARNGPRVVVVDSETDADLDAVVRAASAVPAPVVWVGSGGLAAALARTLIADPVPVQLPSVAGPVLVVVGSGTPQSAAQATAFRDTGACEVAFSAAQLLTGDPAVLSPAAERTARLLSRGTDVLVRISEGSRIPSGMGRHAVTTLARALAAAEPDPACLVVTGGETARVVTVAMGATGLALAGELQPGVVVGRLEGRLPCPVVTKAGGFGEPGALVDAVAGLRSARATDPVQPGPVTTFREESR